MHMKKSHVIAFNTTATFTVISDHLNLLHTWGGNVALFAKCFSEFLCFCIELNEQLRWKQTR